MKRIIITIITVMSIFSLSHISVLSHSGGTDADGGHYDYSAGEYHYHHGLSAHSHDDGICPYSPVESENNSNEDITNENRSAINIVWLVLLSLIVLILPVIYMLRKKESKNRQTKQSQKDSSIMNNATPFIRCSTFCNKENNATSYDMSMIPSGISIDENLLPYVINRQYGYGKRFNAFVTPNSNCYHLSRCSVLKNKKKTVVHRYIAMNKYKPCSLCSPKYFVEDWYIEFLKKNSIIKDEASARVSHSSDIDSCKQLTLFDN